MLAWMLYICVVSLLLGAAAFAAEKAALVRRGQTRWLWAAGIAASIVLPLAMSQVSIQLPDLHGGEAAGAAHPALPFARMTIGAVRPSAWLDTAIGPAAEAPRVDAALGLCWALASALVLATIAFHGAQLYRRRRTWKREILAGTPVDVSDDIGPAVVGLLRPRIVVPRWIAQAPAETQALVMAHEQSHLDARDAQLLAAAILLIAAMPWNLPLWWQLRRLRFAIEVDCDARVLKGGCDVSRYGETLILVGERQSRRGAVVAAMSEPTSFLEQRIRKMVSKPKKLAWAGTTALIALSFVLAASAAEVSPPDAGPGAAVSPAQMRSFVLTSYRNSQWGFRLQVPKAWKVVAPDPGNSAAEVVRFLSQPQVGERSALIIFRGPYQADSVSAVIEGSEPGLAKGGFAHFKQGEAQLGSRTVQTLEFDRQMDRLWSARYYYFQGGGHLYVLGFGTTDPPQTMAPLFDTIARTFVDEGATADAPDSAVPAYQRRGPAVVQIRLVDSAPDAKENPADQRVTGPDGTFLWLEPDAPITGPMFASARASRDPEGRPVVDFLLTPEGSTRLAALTRANIGKRLVILVDGAVVSAPVVRAEIAGGKGQISGQFSPEQTRTLAEEINAASRVR
jgi:hypothetical protein